MRDRSPSTHRGPRAHGARGRWSAVASSILLVATVARAAGPYETPGTVAAADYLSPELMKGENWTVAADAVNDGLDNTYTVESRFGTWEARGAEQVTARIKEMEALAKLEEVSKTEVFLDAVEASVTAPVKLVRAVAEKPEETLKGLPEGIGRWFRRTSFKVRETYHDISEEVKEERARRRARKEAEGEPGSEEAADAADEDRWEEVEDKAKTEGRKEALDYLRITSAERRWYRDLGVDPSTDNELLRDAITSVARVEGLTHFGMKFVPLPGVPFAGEMRKSMDLVWSSSPGDLRVRNRKRIREAGLSKQTARAFEDGVMTLTEQTVFLDALETLWGVSGREQLFALALDLETRDEARAMTKIAALLAGLHRAGTKLAEILPDSALPVARTRAGDLVLVASAGALFSTEPVADGMSQFAAIYADHPAKSRRFYVTGIASDAFRAHLASLGWEVIDRWQPEPAAPAAPVGGS